MKVRWKGRTEFLVLTHDRIYTVLDVEGNGMRASFLFSETENERR